MRPEVSTQEHVVYRMYGQDGRLLYIGTTNSMTERLRVHRQATPWFGEVLCLTSTVLADRSTALREEAEAIRTEQPFYNIRHTGRPQPHRRSSAAA